MSGYIKQRIASEMGNFWLLEEPTDLRQAARATTSFKVSSGEWALWHKLYGKCMLKVRHLLEETSRFQLKRFDNDYDREK